MERVLIADLRCENLGFLLHLLRTNRIRRPPSCALDAVCSKDTAMQVQVLRRCLATHFFSLAP